MMQHKRYIDQTISSDLSLHNDTESWERGETYMLKPDAQEGKRRIIVLPHMRLAIEETNGGWLRSVTSPKGTVSVAALLRCDGPACFGDTKLRKGDTFIFDDSTPKSFFNAGDCQIAIVSFSKARYRKLAKLYSRYSQYIIDQSADILGTALNATFQQCIHDPSVLDDATFLEQTQTDVVKTLEQLLDLRYPYKPKLTKGELIALEIRDRVYAHIEPNISIHRFATEYGVTDQTLQNAFKSLFGMTPHKFLRNLKLNHVRRELQAADPHQTTVIEIATRWGFMHMGHFSGYYTRLFGENPSATLRKKAES